MKSHNTNQGKIDIHMDNRETWIRIESTTKVANHLNQDSAEEIKAKKRTTKEADLDMMLERELGNREARQNLQQNPDPMLIKICDEEVKKVKVKETDREISSNMRYCGDKVIMK